MSIIFSASSPVRFYEGSSRTTPLTMQASGQLVDALGNTLHTFEFEMVNGNTDVGLYIKNIGYVTADHYRYAVSRTSYLPNHGVCYLGTAPNTSQGPWGMTVTDYADLPAPRYDSGEDRLFIQGAATEKTYIIYGFEANNTTTASGTEYKTVSFYFLLTVRNTETATAPVITFYNALGSLSSPLRITRGDVIPYYGVAAFDSIDGFLSATSSGTVDTQTPGTYPVVWTSQANTAGKTATATMNILVDNTDQTPPVIYLVGENPLIVEAGTSLPGLEAIALDTVDGNCIVTASGTVDLQTPGDYTRTYHSHDSSENAAIPVSRVVRVVDTRPPVITVTGGLFQIVTQGTTWTAPVVTATDLVDGDVSDSITYTGSVDTATTGNYEIVYTVSDEAGNQATATLTVHVVSAQMETWIDPNPIEGTWSYHAVVTETRAGLEETIETNSGEVTIPGPTVSNDTTAPRITLIGASSMEIPALSTWTDPGVVAWDETDGYITDSVVVTGSVNTHVCGIYTLSYLVADSLGNRSAAVRTIRVYDNVAPVLTLIGENVLHVLQNDTFTDPGATALDACDGVINVTIVNRVNTSQTGIYTNTYTATDRSGNIAACTREIHVIPNQISFISSDSMTVNQKYWFRAVIGSSVSGQDSVTTNVDSAWLTQPVEFTAVTSPKNTVVQQGNARFMARIEIGGGENRRPVTPQEVTSICYTVSRPAANLWDSEQTVSGHVNVDVPVFPWLLEKTVVDYGWTLDSIGYNFIHIPDRSENDPFPDPGQYKIDYTLTLATGTTMELIWNVEKTA